MLGFAFLTEMKLSGWLALAFALFAPLGAAEEVREWTDSKGRKLTGTLIEKNDTHADILVKSKRFKLPIASLSEEDQEYIKRADVFPDIALNVRTIKTESNSSSSFTDSDAREIEVSIKNVAGRELVVRCVWIRKEDKGVGFHSLVEQEIAKDSTLIFSTNFGFGGDYRGYAVGVKHKGQWKTVAASMKPYERFIYDNTGAEEEIGNRPAPVRVVPDP